MRIISKKRFFRFLSVTFILILVLLSTLSAKADREYVTKTIYVAEGDTVWKIASQYNDNTDTDIREYVDRICRLNNTNGVIYPGQTLQIPID